MSLQLKETKEIKPLGAVQHVTLTNARGQWIELEQLCSYNIKLNILRNEISTYEQDNSKIKVVFIYLCLFLSPFDFSETVPNNLSLVQLQPAPIFYLSRAFQNVSIRERNFMHKKFEIIKISYSHITFLRPGDFYVV